MSYNITVGGLTRILEALAEAARLGDGPLSIEKRTKHAITRQWATLPTPVPQPNSPFDTFVHSTKAKLNLDFSAQNKVLTVKLCAFFALLVLFVMLLAVALFLSTASSSTKGQIEIVIPNTTSSILESTEVTSDIAFKPLFSSVPTFHFSELALRSLNYSDLALEEHENLQRLAQLIQECFFKRRRPK